LRPLTPQGKKEVRRAAPGLVKLARDVEVLATSPLVRAAQTAEIITGEYGCDIVTLEALEPDRDPEEALEWLRQQQDKDTVGVVGHEPHLSTLVGYLLTGKRASFVALKKTGACLLEMAAPLQPSKGALLWLLTPKLLRQLGE
jgi:phosphohistidine phosphatase